MGQFELTAVLTDRAGKRPFFITKKFALDKVFGRGRTVDFDKRNVAPFAEKMGGAGDKFLAGSIFAGDQYRCSAGGNHPDQVENPRHRLAGADHIVKPCYRSLSACRHR